MKLISSKTVSNIPHSKNFPFELVNEILDYCKPNELCAVALANSDYRIEAERFLYRSITIDWYTAKSTLGTAPCLSTLSKIQSKAGMVISFKLNYMGSHLRPPSELDQLCGGLVAMRSLKHLTLNLSRNQYQDVILVSMLIPVLKSCTFSLTTLYIPSVMLGDWTLSQNQLRVLGMFGLSILQDRQFAICKQLSTESTQNSSLPTVFLIGPYGFLSDKMIAFPALSVNARWSAKAVADSLPWKNAHGISYCELLLDNLSEEGTVHDILTSLAEHFLYLEKIVLIINDPQIHFRPSSFTSLHKFPHLEAFRIKNYSGPDKLTHTKNYLDLASSWATNCPKLCEITFPDGWTARQDESGHWKYLEWMDLCLHNF